MVDVRLVWRKELDRSPQKETQKETQTLTECRQNLDMSHLVATVSRRFRSICAAMFSWLVFAALASPSASADISRPVEGEGPTRVHVAIFVLDVDEINSPSQSFDANVYLEFRWRDRRLAHSGPNEVARSKVEVWHPRIQLINQQKVWPTFPEIVELKLNQTPRPRSSVRPRIREVAAHRNRNISKYQESTSDGGVRNDSAFLDTICWGGRQPQRSGDCCYLSSIRPDSR